MSLFVEVLWKMLVLEAWIVTFGESFVSWKTLVLEAWSVTFGESLVENARFGSLECLLVKVSWCQARVSSKSV